MSFRVRETAPEDYASLRQSLEQADVGLLPDHLGRDDCLVVLTAGAHDGSVLGVGWIAERPDLTSGPGGLELSVVASAAGVATALAEALLSRARDAGPATIYADSQRLPRAVQQALEHRWSAKRWPPDSDFWEVHLGQA